MNNMKTLYSDAVASGAINADEDKFTMLQGDIVSTEAAYLMGERIVGSPMFAVLNSTCDLVPGRREYASLLRVVQVAGERRRAQIGAPSSAEFSQPPRPVSSAPARRGCTNAGVCNPVRRCGANPNGGSAAGEATLFAVARWVAHLRLVCAGSDLQGRRWRSRAAHQTTTPIVIGWKAKWTALRSQPRQRNS